MKREEIRIIAFVGNNHGRRGKVHFAFTLAKDLQEWDYAYYMVNWASEVVVHY